MPETNEKPVDHNVHPMNHQQMTNNNEDHEDHGGDSEILDEDVDYLNRLEEELAIRRFFNKYLHSSK